MATVASERARQASPARTSGDYVGSDTRVVCIKIGSSTLTSKGCLAISRIARIVEVTAEVRRMGYRVVLISSGAVASGAQKFKNGVYPKSLRKKQAMAALGQVKLMRQYDDLFTALDINCAQVLLTFDNIKERKQYTNAQQTFLELLRLGVVPIVNENDTVAVEELRFGDNDRLSAMVANMLEAQWLFILSDVDGLYDSNPRENPDAKHIGNVSSFSEISDVNTSAVGGWGQGGMTTKIHAAQLCSSCGIKACILNGTNPEMIVEALSGSLPPRTGTIFEASSNPLRGKKRWIHGLRPRGTLVLDAGAERAVCSRKSLFPAGITRIEGVFRSADCVRLCGADGTEVARGIVNYDSNDLARIVGKQSAEIPDVLGYEGDEAVIHAAFTLLSEAEIRKSSSHQDLSAHALDAKLRTVGSHQDLSAASRNGSSNDLSSVSEA